jgi:nucleoid-associated protein YgaU
MTARSINQIVVPSVALVAACGAALVFGITHVGREPPVETRGATAALGVSPPAPSARDESSTALATQPDANDVEAELAVSPPPPITDDTLPAFDIARIEETGDAVIAGTAAPGAIVELLRNGERLDEAAADRSGHFVMVPPRLPPGEYELTLRSRLPDGTLATSKQGVLVALADAKPSSEVNRSRAEAPFNVPKTAATNPLWQEHAASSAQARLLSQPPLHIAKRHDVAVSELPRATAAARLSDGGSLSPEDEPKIATTVVARGDSLWRISRVTYGVGTRYALVYKANRDRIRDPNRIYPGQTFVLPLKRR